MITHSLDKLIKSPKDRGERLGKSIPFAKIEEKELSFSVEPAVESARHQSLKTPCLTRIFSLLPL